MAGIGFELEKALKKDSLLSYIKVYGYSSVLSAGAWMISIVAIILVGYISIASNKSFKETIEFQLIVTYAFMLSSFLLFSGFLQLPLTRFIADRLYEKKQKEVLPAYFGSVLVTLVVGNLFLIPFVFYLLPEKSLYFKILVVEVFLIVSLVWLANVLASSLKRYKTVVFSFFITYSLIVFLSYMFEKSEAFLLFAFFVGNFFLFSVLTFLILKEFPSDRLVGFKIFNPRTFYWRLALAGVFYNLGVWIDKIIFWYHPLTGYYLVGRLRASIVYDLPIFLAYLAIIPAMAIFFYRLEVDFSKSFVRFYDAVSLGKPLFEIKKYKNMMNRNIRGIIREIMIIQMIINIFIYFSAGYIFDILNIPKLYLDLFYILLIGATLQLCFMTMMALLFYIDKRIETLYLSIIFFVLNASLSYLSINLGPSYFGYGYAVSLLISFIIALLIVREKFARIDYETFMLQK
ncbi:MAG: exopolysaccharide Pel transporter PelG [Epsilonproteobacteria bacterium]|nr:exopolysaccharide Pel transporter PelG [Campylobacterota bacterium]